MDPLKSLPPGSTATKEYAALQRNMAWSKGLPLHGNSSSAASSDQQQQQQLDKTSRSAFLSCEDGTWLATSSRLHQLFRH